MTGPIQFGMATVTHARCPVCGYTFTLPGNTSTFKVRHDDDNGVGPVLHTLTWVEF